MWVLLQIGRWVDIVLFAASGLLLTLNTVFLEAFPRSVKGLFRASTQFPSRAQTKYINKIILGPTCSLNYLVFSRIGYEVRDPCPAQGVNSV